MNLRYTVLDGARDPYLGSSGASGFDLAAYMPGRRSESIEPGETISIRTGVAVEIPDGYEGQIRARSSLSKRGLLIHTGTIDSDYRGEILVILTNVSKTCDYLDAGERIAQLVIAPVARPTLSKVERLSVTARGVRGFGSTGK